MLHPALGHEEDVEQPEKNTKMIRRMDHSGKAESWGWSAWSSESSCAFSTYGEVRKMGTRLFGRACNSRTRGKPKGKRS